LIPARARRIAAPRQATPFHDCGPQFAPTAFVCRIEPTFHLQSAIVGDFRRHEPLQAHARQPKASSARLALPVCPLAASCVSLSGSISPGPERFYPASRLQLERPEMPDRAIDRARIFAARFRLSRRTGKCRLQRFAAPCAAATPSHGRKLLARTLHLFWAPTSRG